MLRVTGHGPGIVGMGGGSAGGGIGHLLDCRMRVWRPVETEGTARTVVRGHALVYDLPCTMRRKSTALALAQGGLVALGTRTVYIDIGPLVLERDVCEIYQGPHAQAQLEVESVARPRGHHIELGVSEYHGKLPKVEDAGS